MDIKKLASVGKGTIPAGPRKPADSSNSLSQLMQKNLKRKPTVIKRIGDSSQVLDDASIRRIMSLPSSERKLVLSMLSDSDRRKVLKIYSRIKDDSEQVWFDLHSALAEYLDTFSDEALVKVKEVANNLPDENAKQAALAVENSPLPADEIGTIFEPLKTKFRELGLSSLPFALLQDSHNDFDGFATKINNKLVKFEPKYLTESLNVLGICDGVEVLVNKNNLFLDGKLVKDESLEELFADDNDEQDPADNDPAPEDNDPQDNEPEDTDPQPVDLDDLEPGDTDPEPESTEEMLQSLIDFRETGDIKYLQPILSMSGVSSAVTDSIRAIIDDSDDDNEIEISEEAYEKIIEGVKEDLKERGLKVPDALLLPKTLAPKVKVDIPVFDDTAGTLTCDRYRNMMVADHHKSVFALATTLQGTVLPGKVKDGKVTFAGRTQNMVKESSVSDSYVTADSYIAAAVKLNYLDVLDSALYKRAVSDCGYCCTSEPSELCKVCVDPTPLKEISALPEVNIVVVSPEPVDSFYQKEPCCESREVTIEDTPYYVRGFK